MSLGDLTAGELRRLALDPVLYCKSVLNATPDDWQGDVLSTYVDHPLIAVRSCTGPGKDALFSFITLHFLHVGYLIPWLRGMTGASTAPPKFILTSTDEDQLSTVLWTEQKLWMDQSNGLGDIFEWTATKIRHRSREYRDTWYAAAITSAKRKDSSGNTHVGGSQGQHRENMMVGFDEAAHIEEAYWAAYLGTLSQKFNRLLAFGNPDRLSGMFSRIWHDKSLAGLWQRYTIAGRENPQARASVMLGDKVFVSPRAAEGPNHNILIRTWGAKHPFVQAKVYGVHPTSALPNTGYAWEEMRAARVPQRVIPSAQDPVQIGVDVARFGDSETVYTPRRGRKFRQRIERKQSIDHIVDTIFEIAEEEPDLNLPEYDYRPWAFIDETGVGGGVVDGLRRRGYRNIVGVSFGGTPRQPEKYFNLAAEMWLEDAKDYFRCAHCNGYFEAHADDVSEGGILMPPTIACPGYECSSEIPDDDELTNQAISRQYKIVKPKALHGKTKIERRAIESKDEIRARGGKSPDRMDSFCLATVKRRRPRIL